MSFINSPFEQFMLIDGFPISRVSLAIVFVLIGCFFYFMISYSSSFSWDSGKIYAEKAFSGKMALIQEGGLSIYTFIQSLINNTLALMGLNLFTIIGCCFLWILLLNLIGMIPYSFTATSHISTVGGLALGIFLGIQIIGVGLHGKHLFSLFLPSGAPMWLVPILPLIEFLSYIFRIFSLAIRLVANMTAGHLLIHIFAGFAWKMTRGILWLLFPVVFSLVLALNGLELAIAGLQAYVFAILLCIYLADILYNKHD